MATITLMRDMYPEGKNPLPGTFGVLTLPSGKNLQTVERPWLKNEPFISCIYEGVYTLRKRLSPVVKASTRGEYEDGWEVTNVQDRTYIMFHPGNWSTDVQGCIAVGMGRGKIADKPAVTNSLQAFHLFMDELESETEHTLIIRSIDPRGQY